MFRPVHCVFSAVVAAGLFLGGCEAPQSNVAIERNSTGTAASHDDADHGPVVTLTADNFEEIVLKSDKPVLVDFWAPWCGPCVQMAPTIGEIAKEYEGKIVVGKLNVDDAGEIAQKYEASSIPLFVVFRNGEVAGRAVGSQAKEELTDALKLND